MYYALVDVDNAYVSCERAFRPDLNGKAVVVLSNNDGCVIAQSNEAKAMGIERGTPYFKLSELFPGKQIYAFSSNYELYADMTRRLMNIVSRDVPEFHRYSIDEGFCVFPDMTESDLKIWGEQLYERIWRGLGIPVSIGIGRTKTLAKVAGRFAKVYPGYHHCCIIYTEKQQKKALDMFPIEKVWGIGRRWAEALQLSQLKTAGDFAAQPESWVRARFNVIGQRTWKELNGQDCIPVDDMNLERTRKRSICVSRSFPHPIYQFEDIRTHVANDAARCAERLRQQHQVALRIGVFIDTGPYRGAHHSNGMFRMHTLLTPSASTRIIASTALRCLKSAFLQGYSYKRAGVLLMDVCPDSGVQTDFIDYRPDRYKKECRLDAAIDRINRINGSETVVLAARQYTAKDGKGKAVKFADAIRRNRKSPEYTTRWSDILEVD